MDGKEQTAGELQEKEGEDKGGLAVTFSSTLSEAERPMMSYCHDQTETNTKKTGELAQRQSCWMSSWAAFKYVSSLSREDDIKIRDSDRVTSVCLLISSILTIIALVFQAAHRLSLLIACDALVFLVLLFYIVNRFGILHTLKPKQALLTWQLIMGAGFVGIYMTINLAMLITFIVTKATDH